MKYIVMETKLGYAIVMDSKGRFSKVVNLDYEVGQELDQVLSFEMKDTRKRKFFVRTIALAVAACLCIFTYGGYTNFIATYGTIRLQMNPDILIDVNRKNLVVDLTPLNEDGKALINNYNYRFQSLETVTCDFIDKAMQLGYLGEDGEVLINASSEHDDWNIATEHQLIGTLTKHLENDISVHTGDFENITDDNMQNDDNSNDNFDDDHDDHDDDHNDDHDDGHDDDSNDQHIGTLAKCTARGEEVAALQPARARSVRLDAHFL